jgi:hypothetical protein
MESYAETQIYKSRYNAVASIAGVYLNFVSYVMSNNIKEPLIIIGFPMQ